jgi:hypothetical protein
LIASAFAAVAPGLLWLSSASQPGALTALLATLALIAFLNAIELGRYTDWLLLGVATALMLWTHQLAGVMVAVLHIGAVVTIWKRRRRGRAVASALLGWGGALIISGVALAASLSYRHGFGPSDVLPPYEYATTGAPGAGRSVLGLAGAALSGLFGLHPGDVMSRLLALWPLCILATFALFGRAWSWRGGLLVAMAVCPFLTLLVMQIAGVPRNPPFALVWTAPAIPMLAIGVGRAISLAGRWRSARLLGVAVVGIMSVAAIDQEARVDAVPRFDVAPAVDELRSSVKPGEVVVYAPETIGDLLRHELPDVELIAAADASPSIVIDTAIVHVIAAFGLDAEAPSLDATVAFVHDIAATRPLKSETLHGDTKVWMFG